MLKKVQPGDPLRIPAETYNTFIDTARDFQHRRHQQRQPQRTQPAGDRGVILVKNASGTARGRFDVLGLDTPLIPPMANLDVFQDRVALAGSTPASGHAGRFAILIEPLAPDAIGRAVVSGAVCVQVNVTSEAHGFADVSPGTCASLASAETGPARILWKEAGTGTLWAVVRLGNAGGAGGTTGWAKAWESWTDPASGAPFVRCHPCSDSDGNGTDTGTTINVLLPRIPGRDPNVQIGQVLAYEDANGELVAISGYLDDAIGTVKMWRGDPANVPAGWRVYADLTGRFPVGYDAGHGDYGSIGNNGGVSSHDHGGNTGSHSPDREDYVLTDCTYLSHYFDPHMHTISSVDHRPPYGVIAFIERYC